VLRIKKNFFRGSLSYKAQAERRLDATCCREFATSQKTSYQAPSPGYPSCLREMTLRSVAYELWTFDPWLLRGLSRMLSTLAAVSWPFLPVQGRRPQRSSTAGVPCLERLTKSYYYAVWVGQPCHPTWTSNQGYPRLLRGWTVCIGSYEIEECYLSNSMGIVLNSLAPKTLSSLSIGTFPLFLCIVQVS